MNQLRVIAIERDTLVFNNGMLLYSDHDRQCCEKHYLSLHDLKLDDFDGLEFDLSTDNFFERIENYGIALLPINGFPIRIPGYAENNGWYSSDRSLVIANEMGELKSYDITECQDY